MIRINSFKTYFKYFVLILPFLLLSCGGTDPVSPPETKTYTVTFETNGGSAVTSQRVIEGGKAVKPTNDPTKEGYTFVGWFATGTGEAFDFDTPVTKDLTLNAIWGYEVAFETNGGSAIESQTIIEGGKVVKPTSDPTKDGQTFVGWFATGTGEAFNFDTPVTSNLTLNAIWGYEVAFDTNGGSTVDNQTIIEGGKAVKPTNDPTKDNLTFAGWSMTSDGTGVVFNFDTIVTKDLTLYARWADRTRTYTITFNTNGGSDEENQTIAGGEKVVKPTNDPTKNDYIFVGWFAMDTSEAFDFDTAVTRDLTLNAIWGYTVVFNTNGGSAIESQRVIEGGKVVKPTSDPTKSTQIFVGWFATGTGDAFDFDTAVTRDLTLYAIWGYTVVFNTNGGSAIESQTIADGEKAVKPTNDPTKDGQTFVGWYANVTGTGDAFDFDTPVTKDLTLHAIWIDITKTYTIAFETNGGDAVSEQKPKGGGKVTFVGANQASKAFVWWYTSATLDVNTRYDFDKVVTGDITLYAKWEDASKYTISDNKITYISDASGIVEIPYSVASSQVKVVEGISNRNIFVLEDYSDNKTVTEVILPNSVTSIGAQAFYFCKSLTSITIPDSVTSIGFNAFGECPIKSITIPDSVTSIGETVFQFCRSLTSITIPNSITSIGNYIFAECISLTSVIIPNSVTSIGDGAFNRCSALTSITIPDGVTSIGAQAFNKCIQLASVRVEAIMPPTIKKFEGIDLNIFNNTPSSLSITVPAASVEAYKAAPNWSTYATKITGY